MSSALSLKDINDKLEDLNEAQERLINELKTKHKEAYDWLVENDINLRDLATYADKIAASLMAAPAITISVSTIKDVDLSKSTSPSAITINMDVLNNEEKIGVTVWGHYGYLINKTAEKYNLDPKVIFATIMVESMGNPNATRYEPHINDSSYGLGQILFSTARGLGYEGSAKQMLEPETSIDLIGRYHRRSLDAYGDLSPEQLATAYNTGSPSGRPIYGHLEKFSKWLNLGDKLGVRNART